MHFPCNQSNQFHANRDDWRHRGQALSTVIATVIVLVLALWSLMVMVSAVGIGNHVLNIQIAKVHILLHSKPSLHVLPLVFRTQNLPPCQMKSLLSNGIKFMSVALIN